MPELKHAGLRPWIGLLIMALLVAPPSEADARPSVPCVSAQGSDEALLRAFRERENSEDLRRRLLPLSSPALPLLFRIAVAGRLPGVGDEIPCALSEEERRVVREVLSILPRRQVITFLEDLSAVEQTAPTRLEAQRLLASMGTGDHLLLLARLTASPRERGLSHGLRPGFERALATILARDPGGFAHLRTLVREGPPPLGGSVIDAMGADPSDRGTGRLSDLLGYARDLDPLILLRIGERGGPGKIPERGVSDQVRRYLTHRDPTCLCAAARAAGRWRDDEALPLLLDLLDHAEARVRGASCSALREITGLGFEPDVQRWRSWYDTEMDWWDTMGNSILSRVERSRGAEFVRATGELLRHRLFRVRSAESLIAALDRHDVGEVRLICTVLGNLGAPNAIPVLEDCLQSPEPIIRLEAARSLERLTGRRPGAETDSGMGADGDG